MRLQFLVPILLILCDIAQSMRYCAMCSISLLGDGNERKYKRKIDYFHLQFVRYCTDCAILHNMGRIVNGIWSPMYNNHIWNNFGQYHWEEFMFFYIPYDQNP